MQTWKAALFYKADLMLGEGAIWHPGWTKFLYVDIEGRKVGCIDPETKIIEERNVGKRIGTVALAANDKLIVALQGSIEELDFKAGEQKELIKIESDKTDNRCNDGKCDAAGRLWVGTMHVEAKLNEGALYCYDDSLQKKISNTSVSNGICWTNDSRTMYYIDSFDYNIKAYDFDLNTGNISNERVVVSITDNEHTPDGMCMDEEGMLWVAMWGGFAVHRYNPFTGNCIGKVMVDAPLVTSCALGGNNMQQLFITTAKKGLNAEQLQKYPLSGSLFIVDTNTRGAAVNYFKIKNHHPQF